MKYEDLWTLKDGWRCCICGKTGAYGWTMQDTHWIHLKCGKITNSYSDDLQVYRNVAEKKLKHKCALCGKAFQNKRDRSKCKHE